MEIENTHISKVMGGYRETIGKDIIATGIAELDKQIEGFGMGELITLLGYPGDDKLYATVRIMSYQAVDNDTPLHTFVQGKRQRLSLVDYYVIVVVRYLIGCLNMKC